MNPERTSALPPEATPPAATTMEQEWSSRQSRADQVCLQAQGDRLLLIFPAATASNLEWLDLWQQFQIRLDAGNRFWQPRTPVDLVVGDRLLDQRQLQQLVDALTAADLQLQRVHTSRRQTAVTAATAGYSVEQNSPIAPLQPTAETKLASDRTAPSPLADPLYLQTTLRSGSEIHHPGTVVVLGDLNPGSAVIADGDIMVWGRLRGIAHAGASGNEQCRIMALQMEPTQLRIADQVARAPANSPQVFYPEVAYMADGGIRIARATDFAKNLLLPLPNGSGSS